MARTDEHGLFWTHRDDVGILEKDDTTVLALLANAPSAAMCTALGHVEAPR